MLLVKNWNAPNVEHLVRLCSIKTLNFVKIALFRKVISARNVKFHWFDSWNFEKNELMKHKNGHLRHRKNMVIIESSLIKTLIIWHQVFIWLNVISSLSQSYLSSNLISLSLFTIWAYFVWVFLLYLLDFSLNIWISI